MLGFHEAGGQPTAQPALSLFTLRLVIYSPGTNMLSICKRQGLG